MSSLEQHGRWAIERHFMAEAFGGYMWTLYENVRVAGKKHPVHGQKTSQISVWVPRDRGSEDYVRTKFEELKRGE